jgi:hypothetical protein
MKNIIKKDFLIFLIFILIISITTSSASSLNVQRGTTTMSGTSLDIGINEVNTTQSFITLNLRSSSNHPRNHFITATFLDNTTIRLTKYGPQSSEISWEVVEHQNLYVQRAETSFGAAVSQIDVSINSINISESFVLITSKIDTVTGSDHIQALFTAELTNSTNLRLTRAATGKSAEVEWQIIQWNGSSVQSGTILPSTTPTTSNINEVALNNSFISTTLRSTSTATRDTYARTYFVNSSQIASYRGRDTGISTVFYYIISQPDLKVQQGETSYLSSATATINEEVNMDKTFLMSSFSTNDVSTGTMSRISATKTITNSTSISFEKNTASGTHTDNWFAVEYFSSIDPKEPQIDFTSPTTITGTHAQNYIEANVTATDDIAIDTITIFLYKNTDILNSTSSSTSPLFYNFTNLSPGTYYLNATANNTEGKQNKTETRTIILDYYTRWSNPQKNVTDVYNGKTIKFNTSWTAQPELAGFIFSTNQTGTWINSSYIEFSGTTNTSEYTINITADSGTNVGWYFWANNTLEIANQTDIQSFIVEEIPTSLILSVDKEIYEQGYTYGNAFDTVWFEVEYNSTEGAVTNATCLVVTDASDDFVYLDYNISTGKYEGNLSTYLLHGFTKFNATCSKKNYETTSNTTTAWVVMSTYLWESGNRTFGDSHEFSSYLRRTPTEGSVFTHSEGFSLNEGENNNIIVFHYCGAGENCSLARTYHMDGKTVMRMNVSINDTQCKPYLCHIIKDTNFDELDRHCGNEITIPADTPTMIESNTTCNKVIKAGYFLALTLGMNCSEATEQKVEVYYNYTGQPANLIFTNPDRDIMQPYISGAAQLENNYTIGPNQTINSTRKAWITFNNTKDEPLSMLYTFMPRFFPEFTNSIIPNTTYVYNSTGQLWASDNASAGAPNIATVFTNNRIEWESEIVPNKTAVNQTVQSQIKDILRNNENLFFENDTHKEWKINFTTIITSILNIENVTVWTNYSKYNVDESWVFKISKIENSVQTDITDEVVFNHTTQQIFFPQTNIRCSFNLELVSYVVTADFSLPEVTLIPPTPEDKEIINKDYFVINASVTNNFEIDECWIDFNGTNQTMIKVGSGENITCYINKTELLPGNYTFRVYANDSTSKIGYSENLTVRINDKPNVTILHPVGDIYGKNRYVGIKIDVYDQDGINSSIAKITLPDSSTQNVTLYNITMKDDFSVYLPHLWKVEDSAAEGQTCTADIDKTIPGKAYTSLTGTGPLGESSLCSLITNHPVVGDFDMNVSFKIVHESGSDYALNFQITELPTSINASTMAFLTLSNWTGEEKKYGVFAVDSNFSGYISERETNDTEGKLRIKREGNKFTFYTWNNTDSSWIEEAADVVLEISPTVFITMEAESLCPNWGNIGIEWADLDTGTSTSPTGYFSNTSLLGVYNITFIVTDNLGAVNNTEKTNFTIEFINDRPSTPFILRPLTNQVVSGNFTIKWIEVYDDEEDTLQFNISLLNFEPNMSFNSTIVSNYGNADTIQYKWDTTLFQEDSYILEVKVFENNTIEKYSNQDRKFNITIDHSSPQVQLVPPTPESGSIQTEDYIVINVTVSDKNFDYIWLRLYNSTGDLIGDDIYDYTPAYSNFTFLEEGIYYINATAYDQAENFNDTETRKITIDNKPPQITLISPQNKTSTTSPTTFIFNLKEISPTNCTLKINGNNVSNTTNITTGTHNFIQTLAIGNYDWNITCTDSIGLTNTSETWTLTITSTPTPTGGGGGSRSAQTAIKITADLSTTSQITKTLRTLETIYFKHKNNIHTLTLNNIDTINKKATITITSTPKNFELKEGQTKRLDIDDDGFEDLEITLNEIQEKTALLTISRINETIHPKKIEQIKTEPTQQPIIQTETKPKIQEIQEKQFETISLKEEKKSLSIIWIILILILILLAFFKLLKKKQTKTKKITKEKNKKKKQKSAEIKETKKITKEKK